MDIKDGNFPEIITLCGSTKFKEKYLKVQKKLTFEGKIVLSCGGVFPHVDGLQITNEQGHMLDELHLRKIDLSDSIYVVNVGGYIGESTKKEIEYAKKNNKAIHYDEPI